ncbi:MAG: hypothetical protein M3Q17_04105 [Actinomycetota bacterium]|nr:hypothetical protein [Actinomycetota bacterium]
MRRSAVGRPQSPPALVRAPLEVVPPYARTHTRPAFAVFVVAVMAAGLVGLLLLNIRMQNAAFVLARLDAQAQDLHVRQQALDLEVDRLGGPEELARKASAQGMVPNTNPVFLDMSRGGTVIGTPTPAQAGSGLTAFLPAVEPARQPRAEPEPKSSEPAAGRGPQGGPSQGGPSQGGRSGGQSGGPR